MRVIWLKHRRDNSRRWDTGAKSGSSEPPLHGAPPDAPPTVSFQVYISALQIRVDKNNSLRWSVPSQSRYAGRYVRLRKRGANSGQHVGVARPGSLGRGIGTGHIVVLTPLEHAWLPRIVKRAQRHRRCATSKWKRLPKQIRKRRSDWEKVKSRVFPRTVHFRGQFW